MVKTISSIDVFVGVEGWVVMKLVMGLVKGKDGTREGMREEMGWEAISTI